MDKYIAEFIGTFFLVLTIVCTVNAGLELAPLIIGAMLVVMVYACGHISKAHFNPAITLVFLIRAKMDPKDLPGYLIAQILAAVAAAIIGTEIFELNPLVAPTAMDLVKGMTAEILGTFALAWVILQVAINENTAGNSYYGLAIGFTAMAGAWAFGSWSGGCFNPAVGIGALVAGMTTGANLIAIIIANIIGGLLAAFVYKVVHD